MASPSFALSGNVEIPGTYPIKPVAVARAPGIQVYVGWPQPNVSGTLIKEPGQDPIITLNNADSDKPPAIQLRSRDRVLHLPRRSGQRGLRVRGLPGWTIGSRQPIREEMYANQFAASLLMPQPAVRELREKGLGRVQMAIEFGVSPEAMRYRIENFESLPRVE